MDNLLNFEGVSKTLGNRVILDNVTFGISARDKIGVIGINGTGKSTLLSIAAGVMEPDEGQVTTNNRLRISYLPQNPIFDTGKNLLDNIASRIAGKAAHWDTEGEAKAMLQRFGITDPYCDPGILSGGQKKRAALVSAILTPCDLLILDEPTNHLDSEMIEWLEDYLRSFRGALLMVTHDRYFLDEVTEEILEIDKSKTYRYEANYSGYLQKKQERLNFQIAAERKMAALYKKDLAWMMRGARARSTKQKAHIQRFEQLRGRDKIVEERQVEINSLPTRLGGKTIEIDGIAKVMGGRQLFHDFTYYFRKTDRIGIIGPNGCGKSTLLKVIMGLLPPDAGSVAIGQTVKFGYFSQENERLDGSARVIDYVRGAAEYIRTAEGLVSASEMCERFLFDGKMQYTRIEKLSGGEKRRLYLLRVLMEAPNVLVLDEPTNDLDIQTLQILEDYLDRFAGIILTVSHDRYFLDRVVTRIFSFAPDGSIVQSDGDYEDWRMHEAQKRAQDEESRIPSGRPGTQAGGGAGKSTSGAQAGGAGKGSSGMAKSTSVTQAGGADSSVGFARGNECAAGADTAPGSADAASSGGACAQQKPRHAAKLSYKDQREYDSIEGEIDQLQAKSDALEKEIEGAATDYTRLKELTEEKEKIDAQLEARMERYLELQDMVDALQE